MRKQVKNNLGITLIALVVTIVVLLILAGVSISMLTGENGIISQGKNAKTETEIGTEKEQLNLAVVDAKSPGYVTNENTLTSSTLQEALDKVTGENKTEVSGEDLLTVIFKDSNRTYYVNVDDGEVIEKIDQTNIYTYTEDGYVTGVKEEYFVNPEEVGYMGKQYANLGEIKIAGHLSYYLVDELKGTLQIPNEIEETKIIGIAEEAFWCIDNLENVFISKNIRSIGDWAFSSCSQLKNIIVPNTVTNIGASAFYDCYSLTSMTIPNSVTSIGSNAFRYCNNLKTIKIQQEEGELTGEPWGADNASIIYVGNVEYQNFTNEYLLNKTQEDLEELLLKTVKYTGTFEEWLTDNGKTRDDIEASVAEQNMTYMEFLKYYLTNDSDSWVKVEYKVYVQGGQDKTLEELRDLLAKSYGKESFEELQDELGITIEDWQDEVEQQGYRSEEDALKYLIYVQN